MKNAQIILQALVIVGYAIGLFPFGYLTTCWFVIPLVLVNFILAIPSKRISMDLMNIAMSILGLIPFFGFVPRVAGIVLASISMSNLTDENNNKWETTDFE